MARPKQSDDENRRPFSIRLNDAERQKITAAAQNADLNPSEYVRRCALNGTVRVIHDKRKADPELLRSLLAIGNNLNQIARKLNATDNAPANLEDTITVLHDLLKTAGQGYDS